MQAVAVPPIEEFEDIECPFEAVAALTKVAKAVGYRFPAAHAALRRQRLREARATVLPSGDRPTLHQIGDRVGLHFTSVWRLLRTSSTRDSASPAVPPGDVANKTAAGGAVQTVTAGSPA